MNKKRKYFIPATIAALSLLGAGIIASNQVSANERIVLGRDSNGSDINPNSGPFTADGLQVVGIKGTFETPDKQAIVDRVNAIRKEAYDEGLVDRYVPVKWSTSLERASRIRAAEASLLFEHAKLTGEQLYAGEYADGFAHLAGNLAWNSQGLMRAIDQFYQEKQNLKTGSGETGHYLHMINPRWTTMTLSSFASEKDNSRHTQDYHVSQLFAENSGDSDSLIDEYGESTVYTVARPDLVKDISLPQNFAIGLQTSKTLELRARYTGAYEQTLYKIIIPTNRDWSSSDTSVATIDSNGKITAHKEGTTTIKVSSDGKTYTTTVTVSASTDTSDQTSNSRVDTAQRFQTNDPKEFLAWMRRTFTGGVQQPGSWIQSGSRWWYRHADGSYTSNGWEKINGVWYHFDDSGWMQTGWIKDNGTWYYLDGSGAMKTGWLKDNGSWYYLDSSGAMKTGWMKVSGKL